MYKGFMASDIFMNEEKPTDILLLFNIVVRWYVGLMLFHSKVTAVGILKASPLSQREPCGNYHSSSVPSLARMIEGTCPPF